MRYDSAMADSATPVNLFDLEPLARARLSEMAYEYLAGGSADELTLRRNRAQFDGLWLRPRVLVDVGTIDTRVSLLGDTLPIPILLAPTRFHGLFHPEAERATARGARAAGATLVASTLSNTPIDAIAAEAGPLWFQLYVQRDRGWTLELVLRAEAAGCRALVLTVDTPLLGTRDRERRIGMALPPGLVMANLQGLAPVERHEAPFHAELFNPFLDPALTWDTVEWLMANTRLPLLLKGILTAEDADTAVRRGVAGVFVSNHGGRNLDTVPGTLDALPGVIEAVAGRVPVLLDGGVRRGTDVIKALALGASAVMIGRPYLWGLAWAGADGVRRAVELLRDELVVAMALSGTPSIDRIDKGALWPPSR